MESNVVLSNFSSGQSGRHRPVKCESESFLSSLIRENSNFIATSFQISLWNPRINTHLFSINSFILYHNLLSQHKSFGRWTIGEQTTLRSYYLTTLQLNNLTTYQPYKFTTIYEIYRLWVSKITIKTLQPYSLTTLQLYNLTLKPSSLKTLKP